MYGIFHIRSVSVGLDSQIWYRFIHITEYLNVRKISETKDFRTFVGPLSLSIFKVKHYKTDWDFTWNQRKMKLRICKKGRWMKESLWQNLICNPMMKDFVTPPLQHLNSLTNDICKWFKPRSNLTEEEKCKIIMDIGYCDQKGAITYF